MTPPEQIRNVALIAHINHGKSTLADRLLEKTGTIPPLKMRAQFLDNMELERERGVTIKLKTVRMRYKLPKDLKETFKFKFCTLNLLDTPGHVDFSYEVSRSLAAGEGAILIVDAVAGIQAQTVAHTKKALELGLRIIPVVNKIDLEAAEPEKVAHALSQNFGFPPNDIILTSAKEGRGIDEILQAIVTRVPPPDGNPKGPLRALIFDSTYSEHKGAIAFVKIVDGSFTLPGSRGRNESSKKIALLASGKECIPVEIGIFTPKMTPTESLVTGEVGYIATGLKDLSLVRVGDTITNIKAQMSNVKLSNVKPLPGYQEPKPVVFVSFYPVDGKDFPELEAALKKLRLTDPSVTFEVESSSLGQGFRCGFLGVFHAEIVKERLERDYDLKTLATAPSVEYQGDLSQTSMVVREPWVKAAIFTPKDYLGSIINLCQEKRGLFLSTDYLSEDQVKTTYELPLSELISDFFDRLKSVSSGFASLDYETIASRPVAVARLDILIAGERAEPLSRIVLKEKTAEVGREVVKKLKEVIPQHQFAVTLQAAVGGKILARETIPALRKDVTAKLYGGDVTRKRKLLEKQKAGKKRLKKFGRVDLPPEAFLAVKI